MSPLGADSSSGLSATHTFFLLHGACIPFRFREMKASGWRNPRIKHIINVGMLPPRLLRSERFEMGKWKSATNRRAGLKEEKKIHTHTQNEGA